jgi:hypothetical protein
MVELECPRHRHHQWVIDHDVRGSELLGQRELSYQERTYECAACGEASTGYRVLQQSPPEFFLQPHALYPMTTREFARWLAVFRAQFPTHERLKSVGVSWYPGKGDDRQERELRAAREVGTVQGYRLSVSNSGPDDDRIRVCVQGHGEAYFWCGPEVELDRCYFGFDHEEVEAIRAILSARAADIQRAWERFSREATAARERWLATLGGPAGG